MLNDCSTLCRLREFAVLLWQLAFFFESWRLVARTGGFVRKLEVLLEKQILNQVQNDKFALN